MIWHFVEVFVLVLLFAAISESGFTSANLSFKSMRKAVRRQVTRMAETKSQVFGQLVDLYQVNSSLYKNENVYPRYSVFGVLDYSARR